VQDVLTGFTGLVTSRREDIYGPPSYLVEPCDMDGGQPIAGRWIHEQRLIRREKTQPQRPAAACEGIGFGAGLPALAATTLERAGAA